MTENRRGKPPGPRRSDVQRWVDALAAKSPEHNAYAEKLWARDQVRALRGLAKWGLDYRGLKKAPSPWQPVTPSSPPIGQLVVGRFAHGGLALLERAVYHYSGTTALKESVEWQDNHGAFHDGTPPTHYCAIPEFRS